VTTIFVNISFQLHYAVFYQTSVCRREACGPAVVAVRRPVKAPELLLRDNGQRHYLRECLANHVLKGLMFNLQDPTDLGLDNHPQTV